MMLTRSTVALVVLGLGTLTACDKLAEAVADKAAAAAADAQQAGLTEDDKLGTKLAGYIDCINNTSKRVGDAEDRYLDWVDPKAGLTGKEKNVYGVFEIGDQSTCINGIKTAADAEPEDAEMEGAATEYLAALEVVMPLVNEAHKYYDEEDYKDDKFVKGKELHPKLMAAFEKFGTADDKFRKLVVDKNEALQERELARVEKEEGKKLSFHNKFVMSKAKKLVEASDVKDLKEIDLAKYEVVLAEYEKAVDELEAYTKGHKPEADSVTMFSSFESQAGELRKASKDLMRRRRDKPEFTNDEIEYLNQGHTHLVEGNPGAVLKAYNDLVSNSNRLNWNFYKPDGV